MNQYRSSFLSSIPSVIKNLLIINTLLWLTTITLLRVGETNLVELLGLHYWKSDNFYPFQIITCMFMHVNFSHLFFNMFAVFMFGSAIENTWGSKKFLIYYMVTGIGASLVQLLVIFLRIQYVSADLSPEEIDMVYREGGTLFAQGMNYVDESMGTLNLLINVPMIGASGAVFGILLAFGMLFPNTPIYLMFAIPIKAKYLVIGYGLIELYLGVANQAGDNVAHFAHIGGMLFGYLFIKKWGRWNFNQDN
jgi:membrane associated rhomboid family serine protease